MKRLVLIVMPVLVFFLYSCNENLNYPFMQPFENITGIDIIYVDGYRDYKTYDHLEAIRSIEPEQWSFFIDNLNSITCKKHGYEPYYSLSGSVIRITYADNSYEVISQHTGAQFFADGDLKYPAIRFDSEEFKEFITGGQGDVTREPSPCHMRTILLSRDLQLNLIIH